MRVSPTRTIDLLLRTGTARLSVAAAPHAARSTWARSSRACRSG